uniref:mRNA capping enzyme adenylation domain-containing protein n=1 Tax=Pyramimonas orientalis virus TaxID=455367 RepID=A0A7M3UNX8_POV01|nr:hypothetical protein HWQ62_00287 [Pyramimonas orientalis virus]
MQTGTISFCDKFALNIKSEEIKKNILNVLETKYNIKILNKHFENFNEDISISKMTRCPYMFCLKSNGNPYLMFLTRINNVNTCVMIDKKIQQGYFLPRMIIVHTMFDDKLFNNTLFDGEMVKDHSKKWIYLINDIFVHSGNYMIDTNLIKRHNLLYTLLDKQYIQKPDLFFIQVKKLFVLGDVEYVVEKFKDSLTYTSRGLLFKPMFIKFRDILYNFDDNLIKQNKKTKMSVTNEYIEKETLTKQKFSVKNSQTPDIYPLYQNNVFIGNACVNSLSVSKFLANIFKGSNLQESFNVECVFNTKFNKWTPIALVN